MSEEADIQAAIIATLRAMGFAVKRHNCGSRNHRTMGLGPGTPDLYVPVTVKGLTRKIARPCWIEVKATRGVVSAEQRAWIKAANDNGEYACVARSVEKAVRAVRAAGDAKSACDDKSEV